MPQENQTVDEEFDNRRWSELLAPLIDCGDLDKKDLYRRTDELSDVLKSIDVSAIQESEFAFDVADGARLIRLAASGELPDAKYRSAASEILWFLEPFVHPAFVDAVRDSYADCPPRYQRDLLMFLSGQDPELAADCMRELLTDHGFARHNHPRTFSKLRKRTEYLHKYVVPMVEGVGDDIGSVANLIHYAIGADHLDPSALAPLVPMIETTVQSQLEQARAAASSVKGKWRVDEDYFYLRQELGAWTSLVGTIENCSIDLLNEASDLEDPLISLNVASALMMRGREPAPLVIDRAASSYETCAELYRVLCKHENGLNLFPSDRATFEHFAACEMVDWLLYPAELGYEPTEIELAATIDVPPGEVRDGELKRWCLWRFTDLDGKSYAGISGPYGREALDSPDRRNVRASGDVFSSFNEWGQMTA